MQGKLLMFAFQSLPMIAALDRAMAELGIEVVPVAPTDYGKPLQSLADGANASATGCSAPLGGPMLVLCGLDDRLEDVLAALQRAGVGADCLKAVLTAHNRMWSAAKLYEELRRERMAIWKGR